MSAGMSMGYSTLAGLARIQNRRRRRISSYDEM